MFRVLKPVYDRVPGADFVRVSWQCVGQATDMQDAKRLLSRPVLEAVKPALRG